jgi:hypothetical protein
MTNFPLLIDGGLTSLAAFIQANTDEDIMLEDELLSEVKSLQPGQSCNLPIGGGWTEVKRPVEEMSNYDQFQLEKYGDVLPSAESMPDGSFEGGIDELNRLAEWIESQSEMELMEHER